MKRLLLCTDLDRTLLPNGSQPESPQARDCFRRLVEHAHVALVYVTGRHKALVEQAIMEYKIPVPNYVVADVGSTIYQIENHQWHKLETWQRHIAADWQGKQYHDLYEYFTDITALQLQELDKQSQYKLSYYVQLNADIKALTHEVKSRMEKLNFASDVIWSIDEEKQLGLFDVMPASANKHHAIRFVMQLEGYSLDETVFAGDSGNDISVMASELNSVLVANAMPEIKTQALSVARQLGLEHAFYQANGNYLGMNGNYSAGILEGVAHYMPEMEQFFK